MLISIPYALMQIVIYLSDTYFNLSPVCTVK